MRHSTQVKLETFLWHELLCESVLFLNIHLLFIFLWDCEFYDFLKNMIVGPDMGWKFWSNFEYESSEDWENWAMGEKKASRERKSNRRASPGEIIKMGEKKGNASEKRDERRNRKICKTNSIKATLILIRKTFILLSFKQAKSSQFLIPLVLYLIYQESIITEEKTL